MSAQSQGALCIGFALALLGCGAAEPGATPGARRAALEPDVAVEATELIEDRSVYAQDDLNQLPIVRLTVTDLDALRDVEDNVPDATAPVLFQEGTFGAGLSAPNGSLKLRGKSARLAPQKSYKIKLTDGAGRWKGQKSINLLKNPWDLTRARNYIAFEYFKTIRHTTSMRHQFVQVFMNGEDRGLYEWFEEPGKPFLESHGLDKDGALYKAENFMFEPYTSDIFDCTSESVQCLEDEGTSDPARLQRMLDAVNDESRDINDVIDTYFQRSNYETWLALVILFKDYDTVNQNFFIYSPSGSERWYLLPWDYNGSFGFAEQPDNAAEGPRPRRDTSPATWWSVPLHRRFLANPDNVAALRRRIDGIRSRWVSDTKTRRILDRIRGRVRGFISRSPDLDYLPTSDRADTEAKVLAEFDGEWTRLGTIIAEAQDELDESIEWPMPVWLGTPERRSGRVYFEWDPSFDLQGDGLRYDLRVSRSPGFRSADIVLNRRGLSGTTASTSSLSPGRYFWQVIIRDDDDPTEHYQLPFDEYFDEAADKLYVGVAEFEVR
jgi:spore coat protein H